MEDEAPFDRSGGRTDDERTCENVTLLLVSAPFGRGTKDVEKRVPRNSPISRGLSTERKKAVAEKTPRLSPSFEPLFFLSQLPAQRSYQSCTISSAPLKKHTHTHYLSFSLYFLFFFAHACFIFFFVVHLHFFLLSFSSFIFSLLIFLIFIARLVFVFFSLSLAPSFLARFTRSLRLSHVETPYLFIRLSFSPFVSLSLCSISRIPLIFRVVPHLCSHSCFRSRRSPFIPRGLRVRVFQLSSSLQLFSACSLFSLLAPLNYDRLAPFISRRVSASSFSRLLLLLLLLLCTFNLIHLSSLLLSCFLFTRFFVGFSNRGVSHSWSLYLVSSLAFKIVRVLSLSLFAFVLTKSSLSYIQKGDWVFWIASYFTSWPSMLH